MSQPGDPLIQPAWIAALHGYLPSAVERRCLVGDEIRELGLCAQHLAALLRTICTYLPQQVLTSLLSAPPGDIQPGQVKGGFVHGTVMFADISGFTAMSEKLSQFGKEGAEEITGIVNRFFAALLQVTRRYGGDLLKFGGDALLVFFSEEGHELRACRAALEMQETMSSFSETVTSQGVFRLGMTMGLATGQLFMAHLGSEEGMEFTVMGRAMAQMAQAEDKASAGEIFIDAETFRAVADRVCVNGTRDGFYRLVGCAGEDVDLSVSEPLTLLHPPPAQGELLPWIANTIRHIQALELFLPPGLMDKIKLEPERVAIGGEYRPVTVMFANFYGIDEIIEQLGEAHSAEITAILNAHFTAMRRVIARYDGVVNKVDSYAVGHRIMVLFGAPRAHVDDPERAVRAALEMQEAMSAFAELDTSLGRFCLKQRIGISTGLVFAGNVGALARQEYSVMGDEVNLTARLMAVATEGQVIISQSTARQCGEAFLLREQEPVRVKGKSLPVHNYQVLGLQERRIRDRRPLIGRDPEWRTIRTLAEESLSGATRVLTLVGDVGIGKSRLLDEALAYWAERGALTLSATCPSFGRHVPYLPWLDVLRALFGFDPNDSNADKLDKIEAGLQKADPAWRDWTTLIAGLMGLVVEETNVVRALDAQSRQRTLSLVVTGLIDLAASQRPLMLTIDDLQWADDASIALVNQVARQVTEQPLLLVLAYRLEEPVALQIDNLAHHTGIRLRELDDGASLRLLDALLPTTPQMPSGLKRLILNKARGNPLFIEEMAHSLIENYLTLDETTGMYRARANLEQIEVPDTVNRVIMSRIDRLDESSRNVLRVASVIGKEFEQWLLKAIYPYRQTEEELGERLAELTQREILEGPQRDWLYLFRHVLTREVAYESLLYADRRQLHRRIGESIEAQEADRLPEYWEVLAFHYGVAEQWDKALTFHLRAGRRAQGIYANEPAIHHFREALKAAERTPGSEDRQREAHECLSEVLATLGNYDEALAHNYRAIALVMITSASIEEMARRLGDLCCKTAAIHEKRSDYATALNWLRGGLLAVEGTEAVEAARIYLLGAGIHQRQGKHEDAIAWCQKSLDATLRQSDQVAHASRQLIGRAYYNLGGIYIRRGDLARATQFCQESIKVYQEIGDIVGESQAHINLANAYFEQGNWPEATEHYLQALAIKRKIGDVYSQAMITLNLGGVYLNQGDLDQAHSYYKQSLVKWQALGSSYAIALLRNNMGVVALRRREADKALALLQQSFDLFQQINSGDFMPEVYRHMAEAHLMRDEMEAAQNHAWRSLELAQGQRMRLEEGATRRVLGQIYLAQHELTQAERELQESQRILEELNSRYEVGQTLFQLARLYREQDHRAQANAALTKAIAIFRELGAQLDLAEAQSLDLMEWR